MESPLKLIKKTYKTFQVGGPTWLGRRIVYFFKSNILPTDIDSEKWIGIASSGDLHEWTKVDGPVLTPSETGWENCRVEDPAMSYHNDDYHMIYAGANVKDARQTRLGYAKSSNGKQWTRMTREPILTEGTPGSWDDYAVKNPSLLYSDGQFHLIYDGSSEATGEWSGIGYAVSDDLQSWKKYDANPVISRGDSDSWDSKATADSFITYLDGQYHLFYAGRDETHEWTIGVARSDDLIHWKKDPNNPIFTKEDSLSHCEGVLNPNIFKIDGTYKMVYKCRDTTKTAERWIELAVSDDLTEWEANPEPILVPDGPTTWEGRGITNPEVIKTDDGFLMAYVGRVPHELSAF